MTLKVDSSQSDGDVPAPFFECDDVETFDIPNGEHLSLVLEGELQRLVLDSAAQGYAATFSLHPGPRRRTKNLNVVFTASNGKQVSLDILYIADESGNFHRLTRLEPAFFG